MGVRCRASPRGAACGSGRGPLVLRRVALLVGVGGGCRRVAVWGCLWEWAWTSRASPWSTHLFQHTQISTKWNVGGEKGPKGSGTKT
eukprot:1204197-Prymnesium_polylepis.2